MKKKSFILNEMDGTHIGTIVDAPMNRIGNLKGRIKKACEEHFDCEILEVELDMKELKGSKYPPEIRVKGNGYVFLLYIEETWIY